MGFGVWGLGVGFPVGLRNALQPKHGMDFTSCGLGVCKVLGFRVDRVWAY